MKYLLIPALFCFFIQGLVAQGGGLKGFVYDKKTKKPLEYADVKIMGTDPLKAFSTKENGYFVIQNIPEGTYNVVVEEFYHKTFSTEMTF